MSGTIIRLRDGLSWRTVGDAIIVLDLDASIYLSATGAATVIWDSLGKGTTMDALVDRLTSQFDVDASTARRDASAFVEDLRARSLLA